MRRTFAEHPGVTSAVIEAHPTRPGVGTTRPARPRPCRPSSTGRETRGVLHRSTFGTSDCHRHRERSGSYVDLGIAGCLWSGGDVVAFLAAVDGVEVVSVGVGQMPDNEPRAVALDENGGTSVRHLDGGAVAPRRLATDVVPAVACQRSVRPRGRVTHGGPLTRTGYQRDREFNDHDSEQQPEHPRASLGNAGAQSATESPPRGLRTVGDAGSRC